MSSKKIVIYGDGACSGNPGPGGWGSLVSDFSMVFELGGGHSKTTNNRMELTAIFEALLFCELHYKNEELQMSIYSDSVYVIRGATEWLFGWKKRGWRNAEGHEVLNQDLWRDFDQILYNIKSDYKWKLDWKYVKGHAGIHGNERCDAIAVGFSKGDFVDLYNGACTNYHFDIATLPPERGLPEMKSYKEKEPKKVWYLSLVNGRLQRHETWKECEAIVKGRPAKFKKVSSEAEEIEVKRGWGIT